MTDPVLFFAESPLPGFLDVSFRQSARYNRPLRLLPEERSSNAVVWISDAVLVRGQLSRAGISRVKTAQHQHPCG